ncbi:MAG: T9SS type A sorting domain-containing protein, partial [Flavobacteriaceae bacterium]
TNPLENCDYIASSVTLKPSDEWKATDCDGDGVANGTEIIDGTNPQDGCDYMASSVTLEPSNEWKATDCDNDGVNNGTEITDGTNPQNPDTDGDGVNDGNEKEDGTNPLDYCDYMASSVTLEPSDEWKDTDCDNDGVDNGTETTDGTNPQNPDTDGDGVNDGDEKEDGTDPFDNCDYMASSITLEPSDEWKTIDCDGDGVTNGTENVDGTNPQDTCDYIASSVTLQPTNEWKVKDCDSDGVNNGTETIDGTDPQNPDTDGDGVTDGNEKNDGTNPLDGCDYNPGSVSMAPSAQWNTTDCDNDGVDNGTEISDGTDPQNPDTDGDGVTDGDEKEDKTDPLNPCSLILDSVSMNAISQGDCDSDGVTNAHEINGLDRDHTTMDDNTDPNNTCDFNAEDITLPVMDTDADGVPNACDKCEGSDDSIDIDANGVPDGCQPCELSVQAEDAMVCGHNIMVALSANVLNATSTNISGCEYPTTPFQRCAGPGVGKGFEIWIDNGNGFAFEASSSRFLVLDNGTARYSATATNGTDDIDINIIFSGYTIVAPGEIKQNLCRDTDTPSWEFWTSASGTMVSRLHGTFSIKGEGAFQMGDGANVTAQGFGASGSISFHGGDGAYKNGGINMNLGDCIPIREQVGPTFVWTATKGNIVGATDTPNITVDERGTYQVTVIDAMGCAVTKTVRVYCDLAGKGPSTKNKIKKIYPMPFNPVTDKLLVEVQTDKKAGNGKVLQKVWATLYDNNGRKVGTTQFFEIRNGRDLFHFKTEYLPTGKYFIRINGSNWSDSRQILVK